MSQQFSHERGRLKKAGVQWTWLFILGGLVLVVIVLLVLFVGRVFQALNNLYNVDDKRPPARQVQP